MDSFELDLDDLDLKTVDMKPNTPVNTPSYAPSRPNLTISSSNNDPMPSMGGLSTDKEVDFGLNLLVNKKKQRPDAEVNKLGSGGSTSPAPRSAFSSLFNDSHHDDMESNTLPQKFNLDDNTEFLQKSLFDDNMTNIDLDKELNSMDLNDISKPVPSMSGPSLPNFNSSSGGVGGGGGSSYAASATSGFNAAPSSYGSINTGGVSSTENLSFEEIQKRKFDLLCKFERLRDKGVRLPKTFSMSSNYEEMQQEYDRLVYHRKMENSVKMQRRMLVSFASMAEFVNNKTGNPFDINLDGWSEHMNEEINNYDEIFEDLYDKYKESANMAPEMKLVFMVASSAFWFHISQNMSKSVMGKMGGMFGGGNMGQFKDAAMNMMGQTNPGFANFMNMAGNVNNNGPPKYNPMSAPPFSNPQDAPPRGSTNINNTQDIDELIDSIS